MLSEAEHAVWNKRSELNKVAVPTDRDLVPDHLYDGLLSLLQRGYIECIDRHWQPPWGPPIADVYQFTEAGRAALEGSDNG